MNDGHVISTAPIVPLAADSSYYVQALNAAERYVQKAPEVQVLRKSRTVREGAATGLALEATGSRPLRVGRKDRRTAARMQAVPAGALEPVRPRVDDVRRNKPCLCGSGRKFKKCCGS